MTTEQGNFVDQLVVDDAPKRKKTRQPVLEGQRKKSLGLRIVRSWQLYVLLLPAVVWVVLFAYWPLYGIQIAFRDFTPVRRAHRLGLGGDEAHRRGSSTSYNFWPLLRNTLVLAFYELIAGLPDPDHPGAGPERGAAEVSSPAWSS
jgi:putative aldouronate transport system permease protein